MNKYLHGYSHNEQQRLTAMQTILNEKQLSMIDFHGISSILDVGSGLGQFTQCLALGLAAEEPDERSATGCRY